MTPARDLRSLRVARPHVAALVRQQVVLGRRALIDLHLDEVPSVVWAELTDHGTADVAMRPGQATLRVWIREGSSPVDVFAAVDRWRPDGVTIVTEVRTATRLHYARASWRWTIARLLRTARA